MLVSGRYIRSRRTCLGPKSSCRGDVSNDNAAFGFRITNRTGGSASGNLAAGNADNTLPGAVAGAFRAIRASRIGLLRNSWARQFIRLLRSMIKRSFWKAGKPQVLRQFMNSMRSAGIVTRSVSEDETAIHPGLRFRLR
jgi:hypothetical protein